jgi:hypothetical protein
MLCSFYFYTGGGGFQARSSIRPGKDRFDAGGRFHDFQTGIAAGRSF